MATRQPSGAIVARCPGCDGARSTFTPLHDHVKQQGTPGHEAANHYTLMACGGCGHGALAMIKTRRGASASLAWFFPEAPNSLPIPSDTPDGIKNEFREAEACLGHKNYRAAAGLFRSVLDKTLCANGYKVKNGTTLEQQIDLAAADGVITEARRLRAHEDIRSLGNDVLHDEWRELKEEDVLPAHHYIQRILEDFYDDRATTLKQLRAKKRVADEAG